MGIRIVCMCTLRLKDTLIPHNENIVDYAVPKIPPEVPTRKVRGKGISPLDPDAPPLPPKPVCFELLVCLYCSIKG